MGSRWNGAHRMNKREIEVIEESIRAYQRLIKYFEKQVNILQGKKTEKCCFEKKEIHRLKIKSTK